MSEAPSIQWFPGHMAKTRRLMGDSIKIVDAVVEILDARIPYSSTNPEIKIIAENKPKIILLNKSDLSAPDVNKAWVNYFKKKGHQVILTDSRSGKNINKIMGQIKVLLSEELERREARGFNPDMIRLMIVGIPNVGKSSLINRLSGGKKTVVADKPGVTRIQSWITTDYGLEVLDTPGVLWPKFEDNTVAEHLAFTGAIKDDILDSETLAMKLCETLMESNPADFLLRYKINEEEAEALDGFDLLELIGKKRGMLLSGGKVDFLRAATMLLDEFRSGTIGRISLEKPTDYK